MNCLMMGLHCPHYVISPAHSPRGEGRAGQSIEPILQSGEVRPCEVSRLGPSDTVGERQGWGSTQALGPAVEGGVQVLRWLEYMPPPIPPSMGVGTVSRAYSRRETKRGLIFHHSGGWKSKITVLWSPVPRSQN